MANFIKIPLDQKLPYPIGGDCALLSKYILDLAKAITKLYNNEESLFLVGRGSSGAILCGALAFKLTKQKRSVQIGIVRKPNEKTHDTYGNIDNIEECDKVIIVDDFVASGNTIKQILKVLQKECFRDKYDMLCLSNAKHVVEEADYIDYFKYIVTRQL